MVSTRVIHLVVLLSTRQLTDEVILNLLLLCSSCYIRSDCRLTGDVGPKSRHESAGSHAPDSGATLPDKHNDSADLNITATMGTETIGTARVSDAGTGPNQPERGMTQQERDNLLLGVGSQFGSMSTSHVGGSSSAGP